MEIMTLTMTDIDEEKLGKLMAFLASNHFGTFTVCFENEGMQYADPESVPTVHSSSSIRANRRLRRGCRSDG